MKKHSISIILALVMCLSSLFVSANAALTIGDVDASGLVQANDARLALRFSVGLEELSHQQQKAADVNYDGNVKSDDARTILRVSVGLDNIQSKVYTFNGHKTNSDCIGIETGIVCIDPACCGQTLVPSFNDLVNTLKTSGSRNKFFYGFTKTTDVTEEIKALTFEAILLLPYISEAFPPGTKIEYSDFDYHYINKNTFPVFGENYVSGLKENDVTSISMTKMSGVDFIKELPSSYKITAPDKTVDLSKIKSTSIGDVYKISVAIFPENASFDNLPEDNSPIERFIDSKYSDKFKQHIGDEFGTMTDQTSDLSNFMSMDAKITTTCSVDYYFTADTFEPVCAKYNIDAETNAKASLFDDPSNKRSAIAFSLQQSETQQSYYFFSNFFTV